MRWFKVAGIIVLVAAIGLAWRSWAPADLLDWSFTESSEDRSVFYRLIAKYQHGEEVVGFDIVVGCNVKVTSYGDGGSSFDAFRYPVVFAKGTKGGGQIWQLVPDACQGQTTANGRVPSDLLPGAIWLPDGNDLSFGVAYVSEDAFENPGSQLKFMGASIQTATRAEWKGFQASGDQNLIDQSRLSRVPVPDEEEIRKNLWNKQKLAEWLLPGFECRAVHRYRITDAASQEAVRWLWPTSRPRFWSPTWAEFSSIEKYLHGRVIVDGRTAAKLFYLGEYQARGFPTRSGGGGMIVPPGSGGYPTEMFPIRAEEGVPWTTPGLSSASIIYRDIELEDGKKLGFVYCYAMIQGTGAVSDLHIPHYNKREFRTRIDGEPIVGEERDHSPPSVVPRPFFEGDQYFYEYSLFDIR